MQTFDLSPLFRSGIGFDHLERLLDSAKRLDDQTFAYPPYNIEKTGEDGYRISMAVAGFASQDIDITAKENLLIIRGKARKEEQPVQYLHRGIAGRSFERRFELADHIKVVAANLADGLLHVDLVREIPETLRPRTIPIQTGQASAPRALESKAA
ncbi:MAG: Hsp20 family protein [Alphaproteobacteria bacterium]|nr:Hsp20 family protein [Alphaproteobacteria bacterium]